MALGEGRKSAHVGSVVRESIAKDFIREFSPLEANYILFAFALSSASTDGEIIGRLKEICDSYAVILRWEPKIEQNRRKKPEVYNFDNSISELIK